MDTRKTVSRQRVQLLDFYTRGRHCAKQEAGFVVKQAEFSTSIDYNDTRSLSLTACNFQCNISLCFQLYDNFIYKIQMFSMHQNLSRLTHSWLHIWNLERFLAGNDPIGKK